LVIPTVGDNRRRHDRLQQFMLANDSVTLAVEVPIWLAQKDTAALETKYGIELGARVITGHLDFLQVRNGAVHILDYKPDARTNKPIAQLAIYALAFGSQLVANSVASQLGGTIAFDWATEGVVITLRMSKARLGA
jgi:ATP-dependent exoDNAse (exonuclease V) beta subunit